MSPGSCTTAAHILLIESGLSFSTENINVIQGFPAELLHLNPKGRVPILQMDDETVTEMPAIMTAIAKLVPKKNLLGDTDLDIIRCYEWFNFLSGELHLQGYFALYRPQYFTDDATAHDAIRKKALEKIRKSYEIIEERLKGVHAVGNSFSAADAYLLPFYRWGNANGFAMEEKYPKYTAIMENLAKKASVVSACETEGIDALVGARLRV
jgi:glutathione S-transferase